MLNADERAEREGLLAIIAVLLEDRIYDHELRKLLSNVAIDRHMVLHANVAPGAPVMVTPREIQSFITCTNPFCVSVNKNLREFKKPEFTTNSLILSSMQTKYQVDFNDSGGVITITLRDRSVDPIHKIITLGPEGPQ